MSGFDATKITRAHIKTAMEAFRQEPEVEAKHCSKSTYVYDETTFSLWDLKLLAVKASAVSGNKLVATDFATPGAYPLFYDNDFSILIFDERKHRTLGLQGFNAVELLAPHTLWSSYGEGYPDFFNLNKNDQVGLGNAPRRSERLGKVFIRDQTLVRRVLAAAKGVCQCCGTKSFETPNGSWYLEVHHKRWLSENGADSIKNMVALCPNCHRREHFGSRTYF